MIYSQQEGSDIYSTESEQEEEEITPPKDPWTPSASSANPAQERLGKIFLINLK